MAINTYLAAKTKKLERIVRIGTWTAMPFPAQVAQTQAELRERGMASEIVTIAEQEKAFVLEAQAALLRGDIDLAVCELAALPTEQESGLVIGGLSARTSPAETLLIRPAALESRKPLRLPEGARVASASALGQVQLLAFRADLQCTVWDSGSYGAIPGGLQDDRFEAFLLPALALEGRDLPADAFYALEFSPEELVPAPGKGVLAWLGHRDDLPMRRIVRAIHQSEISACTNVERGILRLLGGNPDLLLGAYCRRDAMGNYHVFAVWAPEPGMPLKRVRLSSSTHFKLSERVVDALHA